MKGGNTMVVGASGLVGWHLYHSYRATGVVVQGTYSGTEMEAFSPLDIRDRNQVETCLRTVKPTTILLPAATTNVDACERDPVAAATVNVEGVRTVGEMAQRIGAKLVYFSSDYVFDGKNGPYREEDPTSPISEYGRQKEAAEQLVRELLPENHLILRTTVVYGWEPRPRNFVVRLIRHSRAGQIIRVPMDQVGSPTYAPDFAEAVLELDLLGCSGTYHLAGPVLLSRYQFALAVADAFGLDKELIEPVNTTFLGQVALRPLQAGLVPDRAFSLLSRPLMDPYTALRRMAEQDGGQLA